MQRFFNFQKAQIENSAGLFDNFAFLQFQYAQIAVTKILINNLTNVYDYVLLILIIPMNLKGLLILNIYLAH